MDIDLSHWENTTYLYCVQLQGVPFGKEDIKRCTSLTQARADMLAEAQTLASLRHPCVIALFGILQDEVLHCQNHQINTQTVMRMLSA